MCTATVISQAPTGDCFVRRWHQDDGWMNRAAQGILRRLFRLHVSHQRDEVMTRHVLLSHPPLQRH